MFKQWLLFRGGRGFTHKMLYFFVILLSCSFSAYGDTDHTVFRFCNSSSQQEVTFRSFFPSKEGDYATYDTSVAPNSRDHIKLYGQPCLIGYAVYKGADVTFNPTLLDSKDDIKQCGDKAHRDEEGNLIVYVKWDGKKSEYGPGDCKS